jgi:type III pantothenate kinase
MKPTCVADVGNSRIKWGLCRDGAIAESVRLPPSDPEAWEKQFEAWKLPAASSWAVSGVQPPQRDQLMEWLRQRGAVVQLLDRYQQLPLQILVDQPDQVGIDRLLNAVAANTRRPAGVPAIIVDVGTAITVNFLDDTGAFRGGTIGPGLRLMTQALHDYTALLPLVELPRPHPAVPGTSTHSAIEAGIFWFAVGGIEQLVSRSPFGKVSLVFLAGGDASLVERALSFPAIVWPEITLEGVRLAAEALP